MGPLSSDGSLERQDAAWIQAHRKQYAALFALSESLSRDALSFILSLQVHNRDSRQLFVSSLLARSFQLHLACLQTTEGGLEAPSDVLLRALLETVFTLCAIARRPDTLEHYVSADHKARLTLLNAARASKSQGFAAAKAAATDERKSELETQVASSLPPLGVEELARRADLHDWYDGIYRVLSQTSHSTVRDMEQYFVLNSAGDEIEALRLTPSAEETARLLKTAGSFLLTAMNAAASVLASHTFLASDRYEPDFENAFRNL